MQIRPMGVAVDEREVFVFMAVSYRAGIEFRMLMRMMLVIGVFMGVNMGQ